MYIYLKFAASDLKTMYSSIFGSTIAPLGDVTDVTAPLLLHPPHKSTHTP